jgi:hypothetical protein
MQPWSMPAPWYWQSAVMTAHLQAISTRPPPPPPPPLELESTSDSSSDSGSEEVQTEAAYPSTGPPSPSSLADPDDKVESLRRRLLRMPFFNAHRQSRQDKALQHSLATLIKVDASGDEADGGLAPPPSMKEELEAVVDRPRRITSVEPSRGRTQATPSQVAVDRPRRITSVVTSRGRTQAIPSQVARRATDGHASLEQVERQIFSRPRPSAKMMPTKLEQMDPPTAAQKRQRKRGGRNRNRQFEEQRRQSLPLPKPIPKWTKQLSTCLDTTLARAHPCPLNRCLGATWEYPLNCSCCS